MRYYFNKAGRWSLILIGLLSFSVAKADILVLVHGLFGGHSSWDKSHISDILMQNNWQRAGFIFAERPQNVYFNQLNSYSKNRFISVQLPAHAPLEYQANLLKIAVSKILKTYPNDAVHIVGHSAGGVVARIFLTDNFTPRIKTLITIASPHLGTSQAKYAKSMANLPQPFRSFAKMIGGDIYDEFENAEIYFHQLELAKPYNFLYRLNLKRHPPMRYVSIIHYSKNNFTPNFSISPSSQDMNNVQALSGQSEQIFLNAPHKLVAQDGLMILDILGY